MAIDLTKLKETIFSKNETSSITQEKVLDSAISLDYLKMDLGLLDKPYETYNTIEPIENGLYEANGIKYRYKNGELVEE